MQNNLESLNQTQLWHSPPPLDLAEKIALTDNMRIHFRTANVCFAHFLEAAIDHFQITEGSPPEALPVQEERLAVRVFPNPFSSFFSTEYQAKLNFETPKLLVFNALGRQVGEFEMKEKLGSIEMPNEWTGGIYFFVFEMEGERVATVKAVKN